MMTHPTRMGHLDVELCFARCAPDIQDKLTMVGLQVGSSLPFVGNLMAFDGGKRGFRRGFDDDKDDVDTNDDKERAWNTDHSDELQPHDDSRDPWRDGPSLQAVDDRHNRSVGSRMGASVASQELHGEGLLLHFHPVSCPHRGQMVDDCRWRFPLSECCRLLYCRTHPIRWLV